LGAIYALNLLVGSVGPDGPVRPNPAPPSDGLPAPHPPSPLTDWQHLADDLRRGRVPLLLVADANPAYALPAALGLGEALAGAPYLASFSSFLDETTALADLVLPASLPLEDWGDDVPEPGAGVATWTLQH